jgi:omega-3 fatty acid desaturase (delta-15 desaturase)
LAFPCPVATHERLPLTPVPRCLQDGSIDLSAAPPFSLADLRNAIPAHCWEKNTFKSMAHLALDVGIVFGLAAAALAVNQW